MRKGLIRLGILLTAIWASGVIGLLTYEYKAQDPPYQYQRQEGPFDDILGIDLLPKSRYLLWKWNRTHTVGIPAPNTTYVFIPKNGLIFGLLLGVPLLGWILAIGVVWVFKGFKQHLSIDSNKNSVNNRPINPSTTSTGKTPLRTHYNNLKVAPNAPPEVIRAAYKTLSQKFHPDRNPGNLEAANIMAIINASYEVLSDPKQRQEHDRWITLQEHIAEQETNKSIKSNQKSHAGPLVSHILKNWLPYSTVIIFILWTITSGPHTLTTDQKKSQTTPAPVQSEYVRPSTAPNGTPWPLTADYIEGYQQTHTDGLSSLTVNNSQNDSDVFVKLVSIDSTQVYPVRQFFIPAFGNFTLNKVKAGMYDIRYRDLTHGGLSRSEAFKLHETTTYNGTEFSKITMTLYKVKNGNMQTYGLSEAEF